MSKSSNWTFFCQLEKEYVYTVHKKSDIKCHECTFNNNNNKMHRTTGGSLKSQNHISAQFIEDDVNLFGISFTERTKITTLNISKARFRAVQYILQTDWAFKHTRICNALNQWSGVKNRIYYDAKCSVDLFIFYQRLQYEIVLHVVLFVICMFYTCQVTFNKCNIYGNNTALLVQFLVRKMQLLLFEGGIAVKNTAR